MSKRRIIYLFSGQGSQYFHMGSGLYPAHAGFGAVLDAAEAAYLRLEGRSLLGAIFDPAASRRQPFDATLFTHPALVAVSVGLARVLADAGLAADALVGYSVGELSAAAVAGVVSVEDAVVLAARQARLLEARCEAGGMLAILASPQLMSQAPALFEGCDLAAHNFDRHFVVAGPSSALGRLRLALVEREIPAQRLPVTQAFHSRYMEPAAEGLKALLQGVETRPARTPLRSATLGGRPPRFGARFLWRVARSPVRFQDTVARLEAAGPNVYVDLGPSATLANFLEHALAPASQSVVLASLRRTGDDQEQMSELIDRLREHTAEHRRKEKRTMKNRRSIRMEHGIDVETSLENAFNLVNAVDDWPSIFPPCKAARVVERDGEWRTIEVTAQVGDEVRTWRSRRRLHADKHRVEFEQQDPFPPIDSMTGYWQVSAAGGGSRITLVHEFATSSARAAEADPPLDLDAAETWIRSVCDNNSEKELKAFKQACEQHTFVSA